jgi:voltage-gated potassium channel
MNARNRIFVPIGLLIVIFLGGSLGYMALEEYTFFQGLYMSAITISTVGYGEVKPLSPAGQGFSILLIGCSIVSLAFAGRALGESLLENTWSGRSEKRKMQRKIESLSGHHIICGYGRVGRAAARQLASAKAPFVVIDQKSASEEKGPGQTELLAIEGDATHEKILLESGIKNAKGLLALLGSDPENVFLVLTARELNPTLRIIARANDPSVENKLHKAGADHVISPFTTAGIQIANDMLLATGHRDSTGSAASLDLTPQWMSIAPDDSMAGMRVGQVAEKLKSAVLGLRRGRRDLLMPGADEILKAGDSILVIAFASEEDRNGLEETAGKDIVIVDDNPVITKLYTRLFQKAGFAPHIAADGTAGLSLIEEIRPAVAVIDYMLPVFSGIEICAKVRQNKDLDGTRLILFTADNNAATRVRAMDMGADAVVVKSPDAQEVIETVLKIIN